LGRRQCKDALREGMRQDESSASQPRILSITAPNGPSRVKMEEAVEFFVAISRSPVIHICLVSTLS
jgi:hypothetical protein